MALWHRTAASLPSGIDDELLSGATEERLRALELTHAFEIDEVRKDSPVDEQLVTLVRDATRIAVEARGDAIAKIALGRRLLGALAEEGHFRVGELDLRERLLRGISERTPQPRERRQPPEPEWVRRWRNVA